MATFMLLAALATLEWVAECVRSSSHNRSTSEKPPHASRLAEAGVTVAQGLDDERTHVDSRRVFRSPRQLQTARPRMLMAQLQDGELSSGSEGNATAYFFVTTSRRDPFLLGKPPADVPSCSREGHSVNGYFGDGDFFPELSFDVSHGGQTRDCSVLPEKNSASRVCEFHMTFTVACPLGIPARSDSEVVQLRRKGGDGATNYGLVLVQKPPTLPKAKIAACAVLNMDADETKNSADQLEDWIAWHRMVGVGAFVLYGVVPPRLVGRRDEPTFPESSSQESQNVTAVLKRLLSEGDVAYVELPARPERSPGVAFHAMQVAQVNDCIVRLRHSATAIKLGDLDEFLHPLSRGMDAAALSDALLSSGLPLVNALSLRWRRSAKEFPETISPGKLFSEGDDAFDAHAPNPSWAYVKSIVLPRDVSFGRIHADHDVFHENSSLKLAEHDGRQSRLEGDLAVINHHFGGGGPNRTTEVKDRHLLPLFKPCMERSRHRPFDAQLVRHCREAAQAKFLSGFGENLRKTCYL
eukprot:TRINITY_DN3655_c2_g1_i1.p1 TRINITY_DN3655_c2_g1~~TRINITY_DN3655_c2_g1_i1.p1  ORF type:complete len:524 (-),score=64.87 TRINITY_DN3655_c2_g1_i1:71-1642(-)